MADPNLRDFYGRLNRIDQIHRKGGGFEAVGTLGNSFYTRQSRRLRLPLVKPLIVVLIAVIGIKGALHARIGAETYDTRIAALSQGGGVDAVGAFVMQADPLTVAVSGFISGFFK